MAAGNQLSRREALQIGFVGGAAAAAGWPFRDALAARTGQQAAGECPRNVIFMVADGMSFGVPTLAEAFSRKVRGGGTHWSQLLHDTGVTHGLFETASLNSLVTDSAAASSAWATGSRVCNGSLNVLPDGTKLTPIAHLARDARRRVGLVTTTTITHATPAGFAAVHPNRDAEPELAGQYCGTVDVLMGGGQEFFDRELRSDGTDVLQQYAAGGYTIWRSRPELSAPAAGERVLGLFNKGHLPFTIDWRNQAELQARVPTLTEMARAALDLLTPSPDGFFLQIEGGRVDHAAHNNDAVALLWDQLAFDDCLGLVVDYVRARSDTLLLITSDHGTANPGLNGMGSRYRDSTACFALLVQAQQSFEVLVPRLRAELRSKPKRGTATVTDLVRTATGIELKSAHTDAVVAAVRGDPRSGAPREDESVVGRLGWILGHYNGIGWTGVAHTADWVLLSALGPGRERFQGLMRHTDAFEQLARLLEIRHRNPAVGYAGRGAVAVG